jgi:hypothetical protein
MPNDWHYRSKEIFYTSNKLGYRTADFEDVHWERSIVLFGCSNVFGIGLAEDETLDYHLRKYFGQPVINLGAGGASMLYSLYNQVALHEVSNPLAVVNVWTNTDRLTVIDGNNPINVNAGSNHDSFKKELFNLWNLYPENSVRFSLFLQQMARLLWKDIPHIEATFFESTATELDCELLQQEDRGRDLMHPGPITVKNAAAIIAAKLEKLL